MDYFAAGGKFGAGTSFKLVVTILKLGTAVIARGWPDTVAAALLISPDGAECSLHSSGTAKEASAHADRGLRGG